MNEYYDDYEQGEAVKKWLGENIGAIVLGIALGLGGLFGWQYWQQRQATKQLEGAEALSVLIKDESAASNADLDTFMETVDSTSYATLAALHLSGKAMTAGEVEETAALLERVVNKGEPEVMRSIAAIRLARVKIDAGELDVAEQYLKPLLDGGFAGLAAEVHGDLLLARGDRDGARDAYQKAMDELDAGDRGLLQMKLDDLAIASAKES